QNECQEVIEVGGSVVPKAQLICPQNNTSPIIPWGPVVCSAEPKTSSGSSQFATLFQSIVSSVRLCGLLGKRMASGWSVCVVLVCVCVVLVYVCVCMCVCVCLCL